MPNISLKTVELEEYPAARQLKLISSADQKILSDWASTVVPTHYFFYFFNFVLSLLAGATAGKLADSHVKTYAMPFAVIDPLLGLDVIQTKRDIFGWTKAGQSKLHATERKSWLAVQVTFAILTIIPNTAVASWGINKNLLTTLGASAVLAPVSAAMLLALSIRGALGCAYNLRQANLAKKKIDPFFLLEDRYKKYQVVQKKQRLEQERRRLLTQIQALVHLANLSKEISLKEFPAEKQKLLTDSQALLDQNPIALSNPAHIEALGNYLIHKQEAKPKILQKRALMASLSSLGTLFSALSILTAPFPPVAMAFGIMATVCLSITAVNRINEMYKRRVAQKTTQTVLLAIATRLNTQNDHAVAELFQTIRDQEPHLKFFVNRKIKKAAQEKVALAQFKLKNLISDAIVRQTLKIPAGQNPLDSISSSDRERILVDYCRTHRTQAERYLKNKPDDQFEKETDQLFSGAIKQETTLARSSTPESSTAHPPSATVFVSVVATQSPGSTTSENSRSESSFGKD